MKLKVISVEGKGILEDEVVWLDVLEDTATQNYLLSDTSYTDDIHISNDLRQVYWFSPKQVKKGDFIALFTKNGEEATGENSRSTTTHYFYWNLGHSVWNMENDCAVLFELADWKTARA